MGTLFLKNKHRACWLLVVFLISSNLRAQAPFLDWIQNSKSGVQTLGNKTCIDKSGNFLVLHRSKYSGKDMDPHQGIRKIWTNNRSGAVINKFDDEGNYL